MSNIKTLSLYEKIPEDIQNVILFMLITYVLHYLWWHLFWDYKEVLGLAFLAEGLSTALLKSSVAIFHLIGFPITVDGITILFPDNGYITIGISCSGLKQIYQITFLLLLFPSSWRKKIWYIPTCAIILFGINILRILILGGILMTYPNIWHITHDWILRPFFYVVIFGMWFFRVPKVNKVNKVSEVNKVLY